LPEKTTTSPSGRHVGHYHSLLLPDNPDAEHMEESCLTLMAIHSRMINLALKHGKLFQLWQKVINMMLKKDPGKPKIHQLLALKHGKLFQLWQKVINMMLKKDPGKPKIHQLRGIQLYEADYNLILALHLRKIVHHAKDSKLLNESLYGARAGRRAHNPVGIEEFVREITCLSCKLCIKNAKDVTACYDQIIPGIGNLASRSYRMHWLVALAQRPYP
jgi:hypothetical protein